MIFYYTVTKKRGILTKEQSQKYIWQDL